MNIENDFKLCMVTNARMASRAISRRYDRVAKKVGLTSGQFSVLVLVMQAEGETMTELAGIISMERTTFLRNLSLLQGKGLVEQRRLGKGRGLTYALTGAGDGLLKQAIPLWQKAQRDLADEMGEDAFVSALKALKRLSEM
ncbi:MarR family winged helix-turn-helix transcriptional regulator [Roseibium sp. RKSG952]|uniref:MarR family winged helix-turn-helix transcriptional regulator n=1 Tax=Roseibium sp. RKSG952 TaxID=2529384 RepID=UPI0012BC2072|nr:MarR family winged helix-turn-helix transcriptional regulator [Roseibium sp. RKSG952]MTH96583.1 MarR family transcriptional regulator [Roseibium sp. RKSG952]